MTFVDAHNVICLDWNGVMDTYAGYQNGKVYPPRKGLREFMVELRKQGYRLVVFTAAPLGKVVDWLREYDLLYLVEDVTNRKVPAILYIDDRAICFKGNFVQTLEEISKFEVFWEGDKQT